MTDATDYSAFAGAAPTSEALSNLGKAAKNLFDAEAEVLRCQSELKAAQKKVDDLAEHTIPGLMTEANLKEIKLANGTKLEIKDMLTIGSVTKNAEVLAWLEKTGNSGLIKRNVTVVLGKDPEREKKLLAELKEEGFKDVESLRWVESQTLKAHVKKILEDGGEVNMDLLGVRQFKQAKITGKPQDGSSAFGE